MNRFLLGLIGSFVGPRIGSVFTESVPAELRFRVLEKPGNVATLPFTTVDGEQVLLKSNVIGGEFSGWMLSHDYDNWMGIRAERDWRRAKRHQIGKSVMGKALLDGYSLVEARILATEAFDEFKAGQLSSDRAITLETLKRQGLELAIKNNAGETMTLVGSMVSLIPGYGQIVGTGLVIGGTLLTGAQTNELAKRAADTKKAELVACRTAFIKGEITEPQYLACQEKILREAGAELQAFEGQALQDILVGPPGLGIPFPSVRPGILDRMSQGLHRILADPVPVMFGVGMGIVTGTATWYFGSGR